MRSHVSFSVDKESVTGELFTPDSEPTALMLLCHGWTSSNSKYLALADCLAKRGVVTLAINLRGHGDSIYPLDPYSRQDHLNDVLASIDFLRTLKRDKPLILFGKSYGGIWLQ